MNITLEPTPWQRFKSDLAAVWANHGTKLLGFGSMCIGALADLDHETMQVIASTFGPDKAPRIMHWLMIFGGVMTAYRGFRNSQRP